MLTGYVMFSGDESGADPQGKGWADLPASASPEAGYTQPAEWVEPERWTALPSGKRLDVRGSEVGFPHTLEGAVAAAAAANTVNIEGSRSTVDEQLRIYYSYVAKAEQSDENAEKIELAAVETDKMLHREMGVRPGGPLPSGAYMRNVVIGYKVIRESDDEVSVWVLARVTQKAGETKKETVDYTRTLNALVWKGGDWKLSAAATERVVQKAFKDGKPAIVAPGDAVFNEAGWTAIREAS
ncbi:hypothetical protein [Streptomyces thermospinosisporus]